jgi:hypothetical protein
MVNQLKSCRLMNLDIYCCGKGNGIDFGIGLGLEFEKCQITYDTSFPGEKGRMSFWDLS